VVVTYTSEAGMRYRLETAVELVSAVVVNGTLVAASQRTPAYVSGDGRQTIAALIAQENAHHMNGGTAYMVKDGWIFEAIGEATEVPLVEVATVPITWQGLADFQVANVLAVVAACRAQGVTRTALVSTLQTFGAASHNVG
jgi:hypothetical protein